jgi:hypothetical protein
MTELKLLYPVFQSTQPTQSLKASGYFGIDLNSSSPKTPD